MTVSTEQHWCTDQGSEFVWHSQNGQTKEAAKIPDQFNAKPHETTLK